MARANPCSCPERPGLNRLSPWRIRTGTGRSVALRCWGTATTGPVSRARHVGPDRASYTPGAGGDARGERARRNRAIGALNAYRGVLSNSALVRLLSGEFVSGIGDWLYLVALLVVVYQESSDPLLLGIVGAARIVPYVLLSVPAGIIVDRYDRRLVLLVTDVARGLIMVALTIIVADGRPAPRGRRARGPRDLLLVLLQPGDRGVPADDGQGRA